MKFEPRTNKGYTVYSKSGCNNCVKVKNLLELRFDKDKNKEEEKEIKIIDCDEYIIEAKEEFLQFIRDIIGKDYRIFPMVFFDGNFIGGYAETNIFLQKQNAFLEMNF